jgi:hypothetical protein
VEHGRALTRSRAAEIEEVFSSDDLQKILAKRRAYSQRPARMKAPRSGSITPKSSDLAPGGIASWFPWAKSPRESPNAATAGAEDPAAMAASRELNGDAEELSTRGIEKVGGMSRVREREEASEAWSSGTGSASEEEMVHGGKEDAGGGRVIKEGEPVEKFEARGETVMLA